MTDYNSNTKFSRICNFLLCCFIGFSLQLWLQNYHFSIQDTLPVYANYLLMENLGLTYYLCKQPCHQNKGHKIVNGWREGNLNSLIFEGNKYS